jgi:hypothetical protein
LAAPQRAPKSPPDAAKPAGEAAKAAKIAGGGLLSWGAVQLAAWLFDRYATVAIGIQAVIALWAAERMGIAWTDPPARGSVAVRVVVRAARGALLGSLAAALVVLIAAATQRPALERSPPSMELLAVGLLVASLAAVRDELLLRGAIVRLTRDALPPWGLVLLCGAASAAARFGTSGVAGVALAIETLRGMALAGVWIRDRGAWMACAANTAWALVLGPAVHGGLLDVRFAAEVDVDAGFPALGVAAAAAVAALFASLWALPAARARLR